MSKRICFIRQSVYPYELSVRREVETIYRAGYETHVISMASPDLPNGNLLEENCNGVHVHRLPLSRKKTSIGRYLYDYLSFTFLAALKVTSLHLKQRFDAIQVNTMPDFLVFATLIPKLLGARVMVMMQEPVPELWQTLRSANPPRPIYWAEKAAIAYADAAFTVTQQLKDVYVGRGARADKITVILNVPENRFLELEGEALKAQPDPAYFTLVCHGAIEERYGHDTMLKALSMVRTRIPNLRLRILGRGAYLNEFLAMVKTLGLEDKVQYLGFVPLSEMIQELLKADAGIVAQKSSPYSNLVHTNKMYEYIALRKPVLATRLKSVAAYFGDDALSFFEPGNPESLAEKIFDLYTHPEKRISLAQRAYEIYCLYEWETQKKVYLSVYEQELGPR